MTAVTFRFHGSLICPLTPPKKAGASLSPHARRYWAQDWVEEAGELGHSRRLPDITNVGDQPHAAVRGAPAYRHCVRFHRSPGLGDEGWTLLIDSIDPTFAVGFPAVASCE